MYCPSCGSNNPPEINFCTRCGTNLVVVSDALVRKVNGASEQNEQMVELLKRYHSGRHKMMIGAGSMLAGVALAAILLLSGQWAFLFWIFFWAILGLLGYGAQNFTKGWNEWSEASVEIKALRSAATDSGSPRLSPKDASRKAAPAARVAELAPANPSNAVQPPSVTEATTRHLEARKTDQG